MTDLAIAVQLRGFADDYERRAMRKPRMLMRRKHSLDRLPTLKASGVHDLVDSIIAQSIEEMRVKVSSARSVTSSLSLVTACGLHSPD